MSKETQELLNRLRNKVTYDAERGEFRYRTDHPPKCKAGAIAGCLNKRGYGTIGVGQTSVYLHRLAWAMHTDEWPVGQIDHINGVKSDNRISNLREASSMHNRWNQKCRVDSSSGVKGVHWFGSRCKWIAIITENGKRHHLGYFDTLEEAKTARIQAVGRLHGEYGRVA